MVELHQAAGIREWQRSKQEGIHHRKNCGVRSDSQGKHNHGGGCESGTLAEHPESVFEVVKQSSHVGPHSSSYSRLTPDQADKEAASSLPTNCNVRCKKTVRLERIGRVGSQPSSVHFR